MGAGRSRQHLGMAAHGRIRASAPAIHGRAGNCGKTGGDWRLATDSAGKCVRGRSAIRQHDAMGVAAAIAIPPAATERADES